MANENFFSAFLKPIFVLNTARGQVIDLQALLNALNTKKVMAAAIDVFPKEPPFDDPIWKTLQNKENVLLTPHIAGLSIESFERMALCVLNKLHTLA